MDETVSINWFFMFVDCTPIAKNCAGIKQKPQKHEWAQINKIQSQYRHTKRKIRRCVFYLRFCHSILFAIHSLPSFSLSLAFIHYVHSDTSRLTWLLCILLYVKSIVILGVCDAGRLQNVSTIPFSLSWPSFSSFHISDAIIHNGYCIFVIVFSLFILFQYNKLSCSLFRCLNSFAL